MRYGYGHLLEATETGLTRHCRLISYSAVSKAGNDVGALTTTPTPTPFLPKLGFSSPRIKLFSSVCRKKFRFRSKLETATELGLATVLAAVSLDSRLALDPPLLLE